MLVPTLHSLCVKLVTENSGEVRTLLGTSVRQLGHGERKFGPLLVGSIILYFNGVCVCVCVRAHARARARERSSIAIMVSQKVVSLMPSDAFLVVVLFHFLDKETLPCLPSC